MKKLSFYALAIAGLLFTACTTDKDVAVTDGPQGEVRSEGFMSLNINLPTTPSMRAINDDFDDGVADEYKVRDCALLLFQGDMGGAEENAVLFSAQNILLPMDEQMDNADKDEDDANKDPDNITAVYLATAEVSNFNTEKQLYALAMLNYKNVMAIEDGIPTFSTMDDKGNNITVGASGSTFSKIRELVTKANLTTRGGKTDYFFMTNAVLSSKAGGAKSDAGNAPSSTDIFQLAKLDADKIKKTREEAEKDPAGNIYVERAVAKATLSYSEDAWKVQGTGDFTGLAIDEIYWTIDNTEPQTYIARNPGLLDYIGYSSTYYAITNQTNQYNFRFVGHTAMNDYASSGHNPNVTGKEPYYRTYWCIDTNYDKQAIGNYMNSSSTYTTKVAKKGQSVVEIPTPLYCYENTFNVAHQTYSNTTRAVIKVTLNKTVDFYTVNGRSEFYAWADAKTYIEESIVSNTKVVEAFEEALVSEDKVFKITADAFTITYADRDETTGQKKVASIALNTSAKVITDAISGEVLDSGELSTAFEDFDWNALVKTVNQEAKVLEYKNGEVFYEARFQHFASSNPNDDLAPWGTWEPTKPTAGDVNNAYPNKSDKDYLGRYGMVRNNWYDVTITDFNKLGSPVAPSVTIEKEGDPDTPDDNLNNYIAMKINVLAWAKRTQNWGF